jgi:mRNA interferase MazF
VKQLQEGEFVIEHWRSAGLNVPSAVKRGIFTISKSIIVKSIGRLHDKDMRRLEMSVKAWLCWR